MRIRFPDVRYKDESDDHLSTGAIDMYTYKQRKGNEMLTVTLVIPDDDVNVLNTLAEEGDSVVDALEFLGPEYLKYINTQLIDAMNNYMAIKAGK